MLYGSPQKKRTGKRPHVPIVKRWGAMKVADITRRDVRELLNETATRSPVMANRVLALVRKMFNFAIEHDWIDVNPCHMVKRVVRERPRDRVLSEDEIRAVWSALDDEHQVMAALIRLRLLTAQRGGELHGARWDEVDLVSGWWTIPGDRSKNGLSHRVPLSPQALRIFKELHDYRESTRRPNEDGDLELSPWAFPSTRKTGPHVHHAQKAFERLVARSGVKFRGHDLRRTAASLMVGGGVPRPRRVENSQPRRNRRHRRLRPAQLRPGEARGAGLLGRQFGADRQRRAHGEGAGVCGPRMSRHLPVCL
jgi:integrase